MIIDQINIEIPVQLSVDFFMRLHKNVCKSLEIYVFRWKIGLRINTKRVGNLDFVHIKFLMCYNIEKKVKKNGGEYIKIVMDL
jgi:hypothetical protein